MKTVRCFVRSVAKMGVRVINRSFYYTIYYEKKGVAVDLCSFNEYRMRFRNDSNS